MNTNITEMTMSHACLHSGGSRGLGFNPPPPREFFLACQFEKGLCTCLLAPPPIRPCVYLPGKSGHSHWNLLIFNRYVDVISLVIFFSLKCGVLISNAPCLRRHTLRTSWESRLRLSVAPPGESAGRTRKSPDIWFCDVRDVALVVTCERNL